MRPLWLGQQWRFDYGVLFHIPEVVQVAGLKAVRNDAFSISTGVVIVGSMKGLMEVAGRMQDEFQCDESFFGVGEFGGELADFIDDASLRRAVRGGCAGR